MKKQKIHFIAIGGSAMHNLAIALHKKGHQITGSDDEIFDPSRSRLAKLNLLPKEEGWHPERITRDLDAVILGMHAKKDNPELAQAKKIGIKVYSYPEYLYEQTKNKKRVAIAGSHGKTTTTALIMHVLKYADVKFDYMVGASLDGFDTMVNLEEKNDLAIFEADEYLSSPIDMRSKFLWYKPHISVVTGIAWDHINVFPTFDSYLNTFKQFLQTLPERGKVFYFEKDTELRRLIKAEQNIQTISYSGFSGKFNSNGSTVEVNGKTIHAPIFGNHNLQNLHAAYLVLKELGIEDETFSAAIESFKGASRRLQTLIDGQNPVYFDFAHAPSKVAATIKAIKEKHPRKKVLACLELHTFSSLNKAFIPHYEGSMNPAEKAIVYFNPHTLEHKGMPSLDKDFLFAAFRHKDLSISTNSSEVLKQIEAEHKEGNVVVIMTSGSFDGVDFKEWVSTRQ
ncbi:UDP-N-acetylmuramate--L-alanine ligase [Salinivirga cyanobacteriivorans]